MHEFEDLPHKYDNMGSRIKRHSWQLAALDNLCSRKHVRNAVHKILPRQSAESWWLPRSQRKSFDPRLQYMPTAVQKNFIFEEIPRAKLLKYPKHEARR